MKNTNTTELKKEIIVRLIKAFYNNNFEEKAGKIPFEMRPKNADIPFRCCIHKERAILRQRVIASLGESLENDDEMTRIFDYAKKALQRTELDTQVLTVIDTACKGCVPSRIYVTDLCQNCVARPCLKSCHFDAITIQNGKASIDGEKCKNCTKCIQVCPYSAITKIIVPCENACPVNAINKNEYGYAEIDFDKCISCGACVSTCPFGAVHEKSQILDILKALKSEKQVVAMVAPSIVGQIPQSINKVAQALIESGFSKVIEVALGADLTATNEAVDFRERMEKGDKFMTTSCCASYKELIKLHAPEIEPFVSETLTPMAYTAQIAKKQNPDCISVFIGPCVAKRKEGLVDVNVDYVMSFEEMEDLFIAMDVDVSKCSDYQFETQASAQGRNFAITGAVAESVKVASGQNSDITPVLVDGLNSQAIKNLKSWAKNSLCPDGNLIEIMACSGGCVGGSSCIKDKKLTAKQIQKYASESKTLGS